LLRSTLLFGRQSEAVTKENRALLARATPGVHLTATVFAKQGTGPFGFIGTKGWIGLFVVINVVVVPSFLVTPIDPLDEAEWRSRAIALVAAIDNTRFRAASNPFGHTPRTEFDGLRE
jgi:hypothetical protein